MPPAAPAPLDPESPVPVYHQLAEQIRARIAAGELAPGQVLEPLRQAARRLGVNLHTVRHAYTALAREGLVESRTARGTRVLPTRRARRSDASVSLEAFLDATLREARLRHGLGADELTTALSGREPDDGGAPEVCVVECSASQCEGHARELRERFDVAAREWSLEREQEPPTGPVLSTYFHYNDVRRRWPRRLGEVHFLTIRPDAELGRRLERALAVRKRGKGPSPTRKPRLIVLERDAETAANVAADVSLLLPERARRIESVVDAHPREFVRRIPAGALLLCAPRVWAELSSAQRAHPRVLEIRYRFDAEELDALGRRLGWKSARGASVGATR